MQTHNPTVPGAERKCFQAKRNMLVEDTRRHHVEMKCIVSQEISTWIPSSFIKIGLGELYSEETGQTIPRRLFRRKLFVAHVVPLVLALQQRQNCASEIAG